MLNIAKAPFDSKELVYVPFGAEKGDCPFCFHGVLRREKNVEIRFNVREGYICGMCGALYIEKGMRYFKRIAVDRSFLRR